MAEETKPEVDPDDLNNPFGMLNIESQKSVWSRWVLARMLWQDKEMKTGIITPWWEKSDDLVSQRVIALIEAIGMKYEQDLKDNDE